MCFVQFCRYFCLKVYKAVRHAMRPLSGVGYVFVGLFVLLPFLIIKQDGRGHEFLPAVFSVSVQLYFAIGHFFGFESLILAA